MAPTLRHGHGEIKSVAKGMDKDVCYARRGGRCERVHDQESSHLPTVTPHRLIPMSAQAPRRLCSALALLAGLEGVALLIYAVYDSVQSIRIGAVGPEAVSNVPALLLQILIFAGFGVGLLLIGRGWLGSRRWVRAPFLLAQIIALVLGLPLAQYPEGGIRLAGIIIVIVGALGAILALTPPVNRALADQ